MKRIHFAADGTIDNVSMIGDDTPVELGTIDVADDVMVGPGMIRAGDGFAWPMARPTHDDVVAKMAQIVTAGFAPPHLAFAGKRLQLRNADDKADWLGLDKKVQKAIDSGFGDVVGCTFRTADDVGVTVSFTDAAAILLQLLAWADAVRERSWALKDAIARGETPDITAGWPE